MLLGCSGPQYLLLTQWDGEKSGFFSLSAADILGQNLLVRGCPVAVGQAAAPRPWS